MAFDTSRRPVIGAVLALATALATALAAPAAQAETLLTVANLAMPGRPEARLTAQDLLHMRQVTVRTHTPYTEGVVAFTGPLARDVIGLVPTGAARTARMIAANDYVFDIPLADFRDYDVILATHADGERLTRRDKGPLWVIYPIDAHPELDTQATKRKLVWQLVEIELR